MQRKTDEPNLVQQAMHAFGTIRSTVHPQFDGHSRQSDYLNVILSKRDCPLFAEQNILRTGCASQMLFTEMGENSLYQA